MAIERTRGPHRASKAPGAVEARAGLEPGDGLGRSHEHRVPESLARAGHVEALVHSVDEEHVGVPLGAEERTRALGQPGAGVAREILRPAVGLGLDDARDTGGATPVGCFVDDQAPDECARHDECGAAVPAAIEPRCSQRSERRRERRDAIVGRHDAPR